MIPYSSYSLQIQLYYDELEVCNPLGSKAKKHKLGKNDISMHTAYIHTFTSKFSCRYAVLYTWECNPKISVFIEEYSLVRHC